MRKAVATLVILLALAPLYRFCVIPWKGNKVSKSLEATLAQALSGNTEAQAFLKEATNLAAAEAWRNRLRADANLTIAVASALAMAGRQADALRVYDDALHFDRRPEMYFNRAGIRLGMNDVPGALEDYVYAARFNPTLIEQIRTDALRSRVRSELQRIRAGGGQ